MYRDHFPLNEIHHRVESNPISHHQSHHPLLRVVVALTRRMLQSYLSCFTITTTTTTPCRIKYHSISITRSPFIDSYIYTHVSFSYTMLLLIQSILLSLHNKHHHHHVHPSFMTNSCTRLPMIELSQKTLVTT